MLCVGWGGGGGGGGWGGQAVEQELEEQFDERAELGIMAGEVDAYKNWAFYRTEVRPPSPSPSPSLALPRSCLPRLFAGVRNTPVRSP
jgi:hypothetical protein